MRSISAAACVLALLLSIRAGFSAEPLAAPSGPVVLTLSGNISVTNGAGKTDFDRDMLVAVAWRKIDSFTRWTQGVQHFEGVPLGALLERVGARGSKFVATALNDYRITIPISDAERGEALLAMKSGGKWMSVRDKGPIWIIYPDPTETGSISDAQAAQMVWQLRSIRVE